MFERCWSDMTKDHFRTSRIEFLKGIRSLIDDRISHLSRAGSERHARQRRIADRLVLTSDGRLALAPRLAIH